MWVLKRDSYNKEDLDHIDGNPSNNSLDNLREVTHQENCKNRVTPVNNKSGVQGVGWFEPAKSWRAYIRVNSKLKHLGYYKDLEKAKEVRKQAEKAFGFHENHGRKSD